MPDEEEDEDEREQRTAIDPRLAKPGYLEYDSGPRNDCIVVIYTKEPTIGRGANADIVLDADNVSRRQGARRSHSLLCSRRACVSSATRWSSHTRRASIFPRRELAAPMSGSRMIAALRDALAAAKKGA